MATADWVVIGIYALLMVSIGIWACSKVDNAGDFFAAGGKLPWWMSGISHHMSGYSGAVFVAHAGVAYTHGFSLYIWWALPIAVAIFAGAFCLAPRWPRLRLALGMVSPMEYLAIRYNVPTQQLMAWSGILLKLFDVGAKWASIAVILEVFADVPMVYGIVVSGCISLLYITLGGLWADALTDLAQFVVQLLAGLSLFVAVLMKLGGIGAIFSMWKQLPPEHHALFNAPYTAGFSAAYLLISTLSYNGGTWNLAQRYIAVRDGSDARRSAFLSAGLYLFWPLVLFLPMWAAPIFLPNLADPTQSYSLMVIKLLPPGFVGLVLASMFAHTMAMTSSDANTISAVLTRDVFPVVTRKARGLSEAHSLLLARVTTVVFTAMTLGVAIEADRFGGILGLIVLWFGALVGPTAVPMILGLLPIFRHSGSRAAISSWAGGVACFTFLRVFGTSGAAASISLPVLTSLLIYVAGGWLGRSKPIPTARAAFFAVLDGDLTPQRVVNP